MRRVMFILAGMFLVGMQTLSFGQGARRPFQADIVIEGTGAVGNSAQTKIFLKNGKCRMESSRNGRQSITISNGQNAYMYSPETNTAMVISIEQVKKSLPSSAQGSCNITGQESMDGRMCDVMQCDSAHGRITAWIDKEIGYAIKTETSTMKMYLKNITVDDNMDDSLFELPPGTKLIDMKSMMGGAAGGS